MHKLGSLFDGSGGFPLAGALCGIKPTWASEVEPYPIAVTRSRFPDMVHLGSVSEVNGAEIEPVDVITFGSPCQDLSVAGKREGLKHEYNGDEETTRSGLFMEAVRIIKEMRRKTNGRKPTFAVWENVPGAFSSSGGADLRTVFEELIKIVEPSAVMPPIPKGGWAYADCYVGDGFSIAYRVFDAQYIRTAQRRRRIYLVFDLRGGRAKEILFKRESLRGYFTPCKEAEKEAASNVRGCAFADDREGAVGSPLGFRPENVRCYDEVATTLCNGTRAGFTTGAIIRKKAEGLDVYSVENHPADSRVNLDESGKVQTLTSRMGTGGGNVPMVIEKVIALDRASFNQGENAKYDFEISDSGVNSTIVAKGPGAVCYKENETPQYIVRRLTPTECARLQGFPDKWGHIKPAEDFTDREWSFWCKVRNTHAKINGKAVKFYSKTQMIKWYNKLHTDSAEYKMWGNGIALPCALYVMEGIADALKEEKDEEC